MRQSNKDLQRYYHTANELYFDGKLPKKLSVKFSKLRASLLGTTYTFGTKRNRVPVAVKISERLRYMQNVTVMTLLHEMLHVENPVNLGHDWRFDRRMKRLAKLGAFDGLW